MQSDGRGRASFTRRTAFVMSGTGETHFASTRYADASKLHFEYITRDPKRANLAVLFFVGLSKFFADYAA